jgi:hypothetical protein
MQFCNFEHTLRFWVPRIRRRRQEAAVVLEGADAESASLGLNVRPSSRRELGIDDAGQEPRLPKVDVPLEGCRDGWI